jgi:tRNA threonylcarbamoyladenosine biosynthesis protein TsaB
MTTDGLWTLGVTSSTGVMSLAVGLVELGRGVTSVVSAEVPTERRHAEELGPRLVELLGEAGLAAGDLQQLAVDVGPGRFTGLRVGLATVRGLAFALGIPVVAATSLEILAAGAIGDDGSVGAGPGDSVTAVIDARRQEVFQQTFAAGRPAGPALVGRPEDLAAEARGVVLGDGFDRYRDIYLDRPADVSAPLIPKSERHPRAIDLLALAAGREPRPGNEIAPVYLRDPDAKANIRTRPQAVTS